MTSNSGSQFFIYAIPHNLPTFPSMKRILTFFAWLGWAVGYGQLYDAQWFIGCQTNATVDFRTADTVLSHHNPSAMFLSLTIASICNQPGNLLYFTNGIYIADSSGNTLVNGDSLNPCSYTDDYVCCGLNIRQAAIFLPKTSDSSIYYLIHFSNDDTVDGGPSIMYYSLINIDSNNGLGMVVKKNVPIIQGIKFREGGMTVCKHANGRDYWIVMGEHNSNNYYKFLLTHDTILGPFIQSIGPNYGGSFDLPYSKFSQDGSKYATVAVEGYVTVMDFDRCSGEFSNPVGIYNEASTDSTVSITGGVSLEFSPSGKFLYVSDRINLNQYDLWSSNVQDSVEIYRAADTDFAQIDFVQLAPNGKLYGSTWAGGYYNLHVINYPDLKGDSCGFVFLGQPTLTENSNNLPNMINYNLGPLVGSGCDTILSLNPSPRERDLLLRLQPNPADKYVYVEMGNQGNYQFDLLNALGQLIATKQTRQVDIFDTENLANGVYLLRATDRLSPNAPVTKKLVVQH
jgi:Secretion system C-terminal sorting domain